MPDGDERRGHRRREARRHPAAATERFGRDGYEHTKWADIAADVGVGPTALYHYFESKQHCLYVIIDEAIERLPLALHRRSPPRTPATRSTRSRAVLQDCFDLSDHDVLRNRLLVAEQGLLVEPRAARRARSRRARPRGHARASSSSSGRASSRTRCARARSRSTDPRLLTRASSASTTASGTGTGRTGSIAAPADRRLLHGRDARHDRRRPTASIRPSDGGMTFFERYFQRWTGPSRTARWSSCPTTSSSRSSGRPATTARARQFLGGREELRGFIDAGDTTGWAHHVLCSGAEGGVEFALGETR